MTDWIGKTLGRVQINSLVARGGMAEVYLGMHTTLQREVAVKILRSQSDDDDPRRLQQFEREARAVAQLRHPNIVQVFDFDRIDDQPYLVMEYIRGPSLSKYLQALHAREGRLSLPLISRILTGVAMALQYAHETGVIHRDVKPGNILLTSRSIQVVPGETLPMDLQPVLTDFGLVRFLNSSGQSTMGVTAGTPAYMSPEQAMGFTTDGRTDIYSLGVVLYEMLSGAVPFDGETTMSVLLKHLNEVPAPISGLRPALQNVLDTALAKNADDRYQEPKELAEAFSSALTEIADASTKFTVTKVVEAARQLPAPPLPKPRTYWKWGVLAGILFTLLSASLWFSGALSAPEATPTSLVPTDSQTPTLLVPVSLGPTGMLQLRDGSALLDQAVLVTQAMPAPPAGSRYEVWLVNGAERLRLGTLGVDAEGKGSLTFDDPQRENLLAGYNGVEVTLAANEGDANGLAQVAYFYTLPEAGLVYLRGLMVSSLDTPEQVSLIHGLRSNVDLIHKAAQEMLRNAEGGDDAAVKANAESILNLLVGSRSPEYRDWNGDGQTADPGDGYGLLLNGDQLGYIRAVYSHADYAVNATGSSRNMIIHGENVKACTQNLARWAPELRDRVLTILNASSLAGMESAVQQAVALATYMRDGVDLNENGAIEPATGECGAQAASENAYHMADMPLLPVQPAGVATTPSVTATSSPSATVPAPVTVTPTRRANDPPTARPQPEPTNPPADPPGPKPTKKPKPTPKPTKDK